MFTPSPCQQQQHHPASCSAHPGVAKLAFTGSTATGRSVALAAARNLRPATCELGGKSALLIFEDAELDKAVEWVMFGAFWTNGEGGVTPGWLILQPARLICSSAI